MPSLGQRSADPCVSEGDKSDRVSQSRYPHGGKVSRSARAAKGFMTGILQYSSQMLVQALLSPIVLRIAGRETLGAYAAITQVLMLLGLVDIAHSWSLERFLGQSIGLEDGGARFRNVFTTARTLLLVSNTVFAAMVIAFSVFIGRLFHLSMPVAHQARLALTVIAVWSIARTPLVAYNNASVATQDLAATNLIGASLGIARAITSLLFVLAGGGLFGLMLAGTIVEGIGSICYRTRFMKQNPGMLPSWGIPDRPLLKEMLGFGGHAMLLNVGNVLMFSSGNALAGYVGGAGAASGFYTSQMPGMTAYNMVTRLGENSAPAINELWGRREYLRLKEALERLVQYTLLLILPLSVGIFLFNKDLVTAWVGPQQYVGLLLTASLSVFCLIAAIQRIAIIYSFAFGWVRLLTVTALCQGIANAALAVYLGKMFGLGGIFLSFVVCIIPQTLMLWSRLNRFLDTNGVRVVSVVLARTALPLALSAFIALCLHRILPAISRGARGLELFGLEAAVYCTAYCVTAYWLVLSKHDRARLEGVLKGLVARLRSTAPESL